MGPGSLVKKSDSNCCLGTWILAAHHRWLYLGCRTLAIRDCTGGFKRFRTFHLLMGHLRWLAKESHLGSTRIARRSSRLSEEARSDLLGVTCPRMCEPQRNETLEWRNRYLSTNRLLDDLWLSSPLPELFAECAVIDSPLKPPDCRQMTIGNFLQILLLADPEGLLFTEPVWAQSRPALEHFYH